MLEMTSEVVEAANQDDPALFMQAARKQMAGNTLRRAAVALAAEGRTTIEEAMRVASQTED
jgi:MSHA biogenesis protein MshE